MAKKKAAKKKVKEKKASKDGGRLDRNRAKKRAKKKEVAAKLPYQPIAGPVTLPDNMAVMDNKAVVEDESRDREDPVVDDYGDEFEVNDGHDDSADNDENFEDEE